MLSFFSNWVNLILVHFLLLNLIFNFVYNIFSSLFLNLFSVNEVSLIIFALLNFLWLKRVNRFFRFRCWIIFNVFFSKLFVYSHYISHCCGDIPIFWFVLTFLASSPLARLIFWWFISNLNSNIQRCSLLDWIILYNKWVLLPILSPLILSILLLTII